MRAWRGLADFEGRSALRSWLYRIATNVCLDQLSGRQRRALPMDLSGSPWQPIEHSLAARRPGTAWVEPCSTARCSPEDADPADRVVERESIRLAFVAALQHLPPRQRAVLLLRDVLRWKADEVAQLLDTTTAAVNSALQRAHATLAARGGVPEPRPWTTTTANCSPATSTRSSATTSTPWSGCSATTRRSTCRRSRCGCGAPTTS